MDTPPTAWRLGFELDRRPVAVRVLFHSHRRRPIEPSVDEPFCFSYVETYDAQVAAARVAARWRTTNPTKGCAFGPDASARSTSSRVLTRAAALSAFLQYRRRGQTQRLEQRRRDLRGRQVHARAVRVYHRERVRRALDTLDFVSEARHDAPRVRDVEADPGVFHRAEQSRDAALSARRPANARAGPGPGSRTEAHRPASRA